MYVCKGYTRHYTKGTISKYSARGEGEGNNRENNKG